MHRFTLLLMMVFCIAIGTPADAQNYQSKGNLAPTVDPGCITLSQAHVEFSPPDLGLGVLACGKANRWDDAADLFGLLLIRARFDVDRVRDVTAHQALTVLSMSIYQRLPSGDSDKLQKAFDRLLQPGSPRKNAYCKDVKALGVPQHKPDWMIQHGMGAFIPKSGDDLVQGFKPKTSWNAVLRDYVKCG